MGTNHAQYALTSFFEQKSIKMPRVLATALTNPSKQKDFLFPITTSTFCPSMCSHRLMKVVLRCQSQDALRSALLGPQLLRIWRFENHPKARAANSASLEQLRVRICSISQDMHALNRSCCVEMASSTAPRAPRRSAVRVGIAEKRMTLTTPKRRRRTQRRRRRRRSEKRACSDTIEESSLHICASRTFSQTLPLHLHITTLRPHGGRSNVWHHERASVHFTIARSFRVKPGVSHDRSPCLRLEKARNPGPATHDRDRATEAVDSVPGSWDTLVRKSTTYNSEILGKRRPLLHPSTSADAKLSETTWTLGCSA